MTNIARPDSRPLIGGDAVALAASYLLGQADAEHRVAGRDARQPCLPLRVATRLRERDGGHDAGRHERHGCGRAAQRLRYQRGFQHAQSHAAVLFRRNDALYAQPRESFPDIGGSRIASVGGFAYAGQFAGGGEVPGDALLEHSLLFAEAELHLLSPLGRFSHFRLLGQPQRPFADQVLLNLRGTAADDEAEVQHVALLP